MKCDRKQMAAAAVLALAGSAHAFVVTSDGSGPGGLILSPKAGLQLSWNADMVSGFDILEMSVQGSGASSVIAPQDTDGFYTQVSVSTPITSATFDDNTGALLGLTSTGGATYVSSVIKSVSSGGSLTVTDLSVDLTKHLIYGDLVGANGLGALTHVALMNIGHESVSGGFLPCPLSGFCAVPDVSLSELSWTSEGFNAVAQGLGLLTSGKAAFQITQDLATLSTVTLSLPEPSSYVLMGLGLVGIWAARRRRDPKSGTHGI
jgi:hypothetical protein